MLPRVERHHQKAPSAEALTALHRLDNSGEQLEDQRENTRVLLEQEATVLVAGWRGLGGGGCLGVCSVETTFAKLKKGGEIKIFHYSAKYLGFGI